jgi:hypothetical protein
MSQHLGTLQDPPKVPGHPRVACASVLSPEGRRQSARFRRIGMEQLWNRGGATGGKGSSRRTLENGLEYRRTVATGCRLNRMVRRGSPVRVRKRACPKSPQPRGFGSPRFPALRPACSGMEQILEQPDKRGRDFVVYLGIKASDHEDQLDPHGPSHVHNRGTIWT